MLSDRRLSPLLVGEIEPAPPKASMLTLERCRSETARPFIADWHSRLPKTHVGTYQLAFVAHYNFTCFGAALWHNPSARMLPNEWLELRRLAIPDDAPPHTASWMLGAMRKWIRANRPEVPLLISYQDTEVHTGTIYKAAGWTVGYVTRPRVRDRTPTVSTRACDERRGRPAWLQKYRSDINGVAPAGSEKNRWEIKP